MTKELRRNSDIPRFSQAALLMPNPQSSTFAHGTIPARSDASLVEIRSYIPMVGIHIQVGLRQLAGILSVYVSTKALEAHQAAVEVAGYRRIQTVRSVDTLFGY
jgi:hypothetical protein